MIKPAKLFDTILFDLGGVIIDLDIAKSREAFKALGIKNADDWFVLKSQAELLNSFERGLIHEDDFIKEINLFSAFPIDKNDFETAWNAMLGEIPLRRLAMLDHFKSRYRLLALSNINSIHEKGCNRILSEMHGRDEMRGLFHHAYYSHEIHERKPDVASFEKVMALSGLVPERTLFFDDGKANVETALSLGFQAFVVEKDICELVREMNISW